MSEHDARARGDPEYEPPALPWYRSAVFVGAVVTISSSFLGLFAPKLVAAMGLNTAAGAAQAGGVLFQIVSMLAGLFTAYKRKASSIQPITLTQAAADAHPANQVPPP